MPNSHPKNQSPLHFDKFSIIECLKKDAHGAVYLAHHIYLDKQVVLKTLDTRELADQSLLERFKREAKILARLDHPNIIKVLDFGVFENFFYISFEHFESRSLREWLAENKLSPAEKENLLIQLARGLHAAHQSQVIHRDIKPENILVNRHLHLKIADFGLALILNEPALTHKASIVGTPSYMSPEQIRGEKLTLQSDLFALGIVAFELFAGRNPFLGSDLNETFTNIQLKSEGALRQEAENVPEKIHVVVEKLLQRDCNKRLASAQEVLALLEIDEAHVEQATSTPEHSRKNLVSRKWAVAAACLIALIVGWQLLRAPIQPDAIESASHVSDSVETKQEVPSAKNLAASDPSVLVSPLTREKPALKNLEPATEKIQHTSSVLNGFGELDIQCLPWAEVYLDSQKIDTTPLKKPLALPAGQHRLTLRHPQYPLYSQIIQIQPEAMTTVHVDLDTLFGYLDCQIYPWGDIFIDGQYAGQTPLQNPLIIQSGNHVLTIKNPRYPEVSQKIVIQKRDTLRYRLNFEINDGK
ncbi:protein kinase [candidate division KSB1 bacterium]|nr:protein kinase [candidate division KSB1 bacterium]